MVDTGGIAQTAAGVGGKALTFIIWGVVILAALGIVIGLIVWSYRRKKWNLKIIVKLPRAGQLIFGEFAKGHYDVIEGIVDIKRKRLKPVGMKPFDVKKFLQGDKILEVMQVAANDFIPIDPQSYHILNMEWIDEHGKKHQFEKALFKVVTDDTLKRKTWKRYMERAAKNRFTLTGFLDKHWRAIELSIIMLMLFIGFSVVLMRLPKICG